jgi:hypothetical protein
MIPDGFHGAAKPLDDAAVSEIARALSVEEAALRAVVEVEGRGDAFDAQGRPIMLFEPHVFWRELGKGAKRDKAVRLGLAYQKWGAEPYPKDSYPRLVQAMAIDAAAALRSCSWGMGQVMGKNHKLAGHPTVEAMVAAMCEDARFHITAMLGYIKANKLDDAMRRKDWRAFARGYNGEGYAKIDYHGKLARSYAKWKRKLATAAAAAKKPAADPVPGFADRAQIAAVQNRLRELGYAMVGAADGKPGPRTAAAIAAFETENGLPVTGKITPGLIAQLESAKPHQPAPERAQGVPADSRIASTTKRIIKGSLAGGALIGGDGAVDVLEKAEAAKGFADRIKALIEPMRELIADHWRIILLAVVVWLAVEASVALKARIEDHRTGKTP